MEKKRRIVIYENNNSRADEIKHSIRNNRADDSRKKDVVDVDQSKVSHKKKIHRHSLNWYLKHHIRQEKYEQQLKECAEKLAVNIHTSSGRCIVISSTRKHKVQVEISPQPKSVISSMYFGQKENKHSSMLF